MATLEDVAQQAGVSTSTVSRAFGRPDKVGEPTRRRIEKAAAAVGYVANSAAQTLATGRARLIGLIVPGLQSPYFAPIIAAAQTEAENAGAELIVADSRGRSDHEASIIRRLAGRVDGLILLSPRADAAVIHDTATRLPVVTINRDVSAVDSVTIDVDTGMKDLAAHALARGHRTLAYIGGPPGSLSDDRRYAALQASIDAANGTIRHLGYVEPSPASGIALIDTVLHANSTAVITYNGLVAYGLSVALRESNHPAAATIAVASADDLVDIGIGIPALTAIRQPVADAGHHAAGQLLARISTRQRNAGTNRPDDTTRRTIPTTLIIGDSL